ncbi:MAG TPA: MFS transporter [Xanthomonadaceae bacterium]
MRDLIARLFNLERHEAGAVIAGFGMFFLLFAGFFMLRPVRETMGVAGGVDNLPWMFTATFVGVLLTMPVFGWVAARVARRRILYWVFGYVAATLLMFAAGMAIMPQDPWLARGFYVWYSVFNLLAISVAWSVLVDVFAIGQAKRLFALMAAGASLGGLCGPLLADRLVTPLGHAGLLALSALLLAASAIAASRVQRWRDLHPLPADASVPNVQPLGGNPFAGALDVLRSPYLMGIAVFVLLLATLNTFLYLRQAELVASVFPDGTRQTQVFARIDFVVQALSLLAQLFVTGRLAQRLGVRVLLAGVPLLMAAGFLWLALAPTFAVFVVVMVARRAGEYAFIRPGREMLYTVVPPEQKYKAKNFNDTVVYRGGDALSAWVKTGIDAIAQQPMIAMLIGAGIALAWTINGAWLSRRLDRRDSAATQEAAAPPEDAP